MAETNQKVLAQTISRETIRNLEYKWKKTAYLATRAVEIVSGQREQVAFLGIPIEDK